MSFPDSFATSRLRAERLQPVHVTAIHEMHQDPVQMAMLGGVRDEAQTAAYMTRNLEHWEQHGFGLWLLRDPTSSAVAGRALLRHLTIDAVTEVEVGYSLNPEYWGRGLATEITTACLHHGFTALGLASIVAITLPGNTRSRRVLDKAGMHLEREIVHAGVLHALYRTQSLA